ncbi:MAG TPA: aminotransferase class III-fold pyridoxal phosphate-dependent enzyme, partial [Candidatus Berkiella sp.]|nr:aminotransferase class III-fold pyridoxal phosphate-dependent enzyme [Candidatus Berkiella sp.]
HRFVYFEHGYHGDTFFTMSVCDPNEGMHRLFHRVLPTQYFQPLPNTDALLAHFENWLKKHAHECAALLIEPLVQGAGGMTMHRPETLRAIAMLCKQHNVLMITDEIFTGFGRTGSLFAIEQANIIPDIICLSKALTGGTLPLAVTVASQQIFSGFLSEDSHKALMHGTTFMGNALGCAAANASLDLFENEPRLEQVATIHAALSQAFAPLAEIPVVKDVRTLGAIGAIQLERALTSTEMSWFKQQCVNEGVWCRPIQDVVYTTPALTIDSTDLASLT